MRTTLDLHILVVGGILEEHKIYQGPRLQAVKEIVLRVAQLYAPSPCGIRSIQEVLCFNEVPLVSEGVIRQAVNSLLRDDARLKVVSKHPKLYELVGEVPRGGETLIDLMQSCWTRHFSSCTKVDITLLQRSLALLFAQYGCAAYGTLISRQSDNARVEEVLESLDIPDTEFDEFRDCFIDFILSSDPLDAKLKVGLASSYAFLRMNGAGNWDSDELRDFFRDKRFLIDTNVLFEFIGSRTDKISRLLQSLTEFGAKFVVGAETTKEFETALRNSADRVARLAESGVDLGRLVDSHLVRSEWIQGLPKNELGGLPSRASIFEYVELVLSKVDAALSSGGVIRVALDRGCDRVIRSNHVESVRQSSMAARGFEKKEDVALHDALLWEAVEDDSPLADAILTQDRSLTRLPFQRGDSVIMLDEVVSYALLGMVDRDALAEIFNHTLSQDLYPDAPCLTLEDIQSIAGMEAALLTGPPRALRKAAQKLAELRAKRAASQPVSDHEVARLLVNAISAYRDDREHARLAREAGERERIRADEERSRRELLESENQKSSAALAQLEKENAGYQTRTAEQEAALERSSRENQDMRDVSERQRTWMLLCAAILTVGVILVYLGLLSAGASAFVLGISAIVWNAVSKTVPRVGNFLLGGGSMTVVSIVGAIEKWAAIISAFKSIFD